jgi:hypothetical protein
VDPPLREHIIRPWREVLPTTIANVGEPNLAADDTHKQEVVDGF